MLIFIYSGLPNGFIIGGNEIDFLPSKKKFFIRGSIIMRSINIGVAVAGSSVDVCATAIFTSFGFKAFIDGVRRHCANGNGNEIAEH